MHRATGRPLRGGVGAVRVVGNYLEIVESLKKPNTLRKYRAVLDRLVAFFGERKTPKTLTAEDLNEFMVHLKKDHRLDNNTIIHNMVIVAQFLKKCGRAGATKDIDLPDKIVGLAEEYADQDLTAFFDPCAPEERTLFATFLLTGFREMEVVHLYWSDINAKLCTIRVTAKPHLGFYPKRWEEREVPVPAHLIELLNNHPKRENCPFVFSSPRGNREYHMLDMAKRIAERANLDPAKFSLRRFRSTYATRMLRAGFDVRTVQHWMGHKSLETTMRYLSPARDVHDRLDRIQIAGILNGTVTSTPPAST